MSEFISFPKIPRLSRECVITEKIDGTNAQVYITDDMQVFFGSRNRWVTTESDNYGFAKWATANLDELKKMGPGRHYGEWWGNGIQRGYGVPDKRFWLFNVGRWRGAADLPSCCGVVPVLYDGPFSESAVNLAVETLRLNGSVAVPGFMNPEGVVVYHTQSKQLYKKTLVDDHHAKGQVA